MYFPADLNDHRVFIQVLNLSGLMIHKGDAVRFPSVDIHLHPAERKRIESMEAEAEVDIPHDKWGMAVMRKVEFRR